MLSVIDYVGSFLLCNEQSFKIKNILLHRTTEKRVCVMMEKNIKNVECR